VSTLAIIPALVGDDGEATAEPPSGTMVAAIRVRQPTCEGVLVTNEPTRLAAYAAVYIDRGDKLADGENAIETQLDEIKRSAAKRGQTIPVVGIDVIVDKRDVGKLESLVTEAERLAHEAFALSNDDPTFYVVGLVAQSSRHDPRDDNPHSARSIVSFGAPELPKGAEVVETEHGYEIRLIESDA
jgi:hypothetical protein